VVVGGGVVVVGTGMVVTLRQQSFTEHPYFEEHTTFSGYAILVWYGGQ